MKMMRKAAKDAAREISLSHKVWAIIFHGSVMEGRAVTEGRTKGRAFEGSDIDLTVFAEDFTQADVGAIYKIARSIDERIEIRFCTLGDYMRGNTLGAVVQGKFPHEFLFESGDPKYKQYISFRKPKHKSK